MNKKPKKNQRIFDFEPGRIYSRAELAQSMGMSDRLMRNTLRTMRRSGIPIMTVHGGGYKLAQSDAEKAKLLALYKSRALDELTTYSRLAHAMQLDGQTILDDMADALMEGDE